MWRVVWMVYVLWTGQAWCGDRDRDEFQRDRHIYKLVQQWAPLILLNPEEKFFPSSVPYFLKNAIPADPTNKTIPWTEQLPAGYGSEKYHLYTKKPVEQLLRDSSSVLFGQDPQLSAVEAYAVVKRCTKSYSWHNSIDTSEQDFHVTYWFFYPFNEGKSLCTVSLGYLGSVPFPKLFNKCLGVQQYIGNHVGDWEHMSLYFKNDVPDRMYVSTHDAGVYYKFNVNLNVFEYEKQETRKTIWQKPHFPNKVYLLQGRPLLYAAKGSHGLWSKPGRHRFAIVPRLYDETNGGTPWKTWEKLHIIDPPYTRIPNWMKYRGRWGNTKSYCHPLKKLGINFCQLVDGPVGIPMKKLNFMCPKS